MLVLPEEAAPSPPLPSSVPELGETAGSPSENHIRSPLMAPATTTIGLPLLPPTLPIPSRQPGRLLTIDYNNLLSRRMYMNRPNFEQRRVSRRHGSIAQIQQRIQRRRVEYKLLGPSKGFAVHFGHPSWNMVLNMMVGIRLAAGRINNEPRRKVEAYDFIMKEKISILPRSSATPADNARATSHMEAVRFIDYAPMVFRKLREFFGVTSQAYLQSVGPEQLVGNMVLGNLASLSELCSEGKSGAFFYYTADGRFLIKTITRDAAKFLQHVLKDYYEHITRNPDTLITRFYGFHAMRLKREPGGGSTGDKLYFIIMGNVFHTPVEIHRRYDLKGSWVGRSAGTAAQSDPTIAMKDVDLVTMREKISVGPEKRAELINIIEKDAAFFRDHMVLDYSLLVGIHFKARQQQQPSSDATPFTASTTNDPTSMAGIDEDATVMPDRPRPGPNQNRLARDPTYNARQRDIEGIASSDSQKIYYLGIIDILTRWTTTKRLEHDIKMLRGQGKGMSCTHPTLYAERFVEFLKANIE